MTYLLKVTETYRVDTIPEALEMREKFSKSDVYSLDHFEYTTKYNKKTDEEYQVVKAVKTVTTDKEPDRVAYINYSYNRPTEDGDSF